MKKLTKLQQRILIYLDSEEPYSSINQIAKALKVKSNKVQLAIRDLKRRKLVVEENGLWTPSNKYKG